jgi:hypothetical protein
VNRSFLWRFGPLLALTQVAVVHCGGSDNSDIGLDAGRLHDAGLGGASGSSDARRDDPGSTPGCPILQPLPGRPCPVAMAVCPYREQTCACSTTVPWICFEVDGGPMPDGGRSDGAGGTGGGSIDGGGGTPDARPPDGGGRADTGSTVDGGVDAARDAGRGGGAGTGGSGGTAGTGGAAGTGGRGGGGRGGGSGRDGGARDGAADARDAALDRGEDATTPDASDDTTGDEGGPADDGAVDDVAVDGVAVDAGGDSGDDAG